MKVNAFIDANLATFFQSFPMHADLLPWQLTGRLPDVLQAMISTLSDEFEISGNIAIHPSAKIEEGVVLKGPIIASKNVFIAAHAYLRGGVFLAPHVTIGPGCEIKSSVIMDASAIAHFNFVGDSIVGSRVNMEAGSIIANYHNDRDDKMIDVIIGSEAIRTGVTKFGAILGDGTKVGANAVLSPGTVLPKGSKVGRLQLVRQQ